MDLALLSAKLDAANTLEDIQRLLVEIEYQLEVYASQSEIARYKQLAMFQVNDFSATATAKNVEETKIKVLHFLSTLNMQTSTAFSHETVYELIRRILRNFHLYLEETFQRVPHAKATISSNLQKIKLVNEYDVQHLVYGLLKPIFPEARTEVVEDTGYGGIRYDIVIDTYDLTIEMKCTRSSMSEKKLTEEIAADSYHYTKGYVFFFVYDIFKIIRNKDAFERTYTKSMENKQLETIVLQPIQLI